MTTISNDVAIETVRALAETQGITCTPEVVADRSNLVLRLTPHPIIARAGMATSMVRAGMLWLRREIEISHFLDARGGAVTRPCTRIDPGPFESAGLVVSFWELEELLPEPADPARAGVELAKLHSLLRDFPEQQLPAWGAFQEARVVFERAQTSTLLEAHERERIGKAWILAERIVADSQKRTRSFQLVHGDAHLRNVMSTRRGPVWTDWEDAFVGPVEWDLACMRSRLELFGEEREAIEQLCASYAHDFDVDFVRDLGFVRNLQVILWLAVFAERDASLLPRMRDRMQHLP